MFDYIRTERKEEIDGFDDGRDRVLERGIRFCIPDICKCINSLT
jgi:hypothetical protein